MGFFQNFPYSNHHIFNLDWILKKTREAVDEAALAKKTASETYEYVKNYFKKLDLSEEVNSVIERMYASGVLHEIVDSVMSGELAAFEQALNVLEARFNSFIKLGDGSTTGDAELADARIGHDGYEHATLGVAIREQVSDIWERLNKTFSLHAPFVKEIVSDTDLDTITTSGPYKITTNSIAGSLKNSPTTAAGRLTVISTTVTTRLIQVYMTNTDDCSTWFRFYNGTTWGGWRQAATTEDVDKAVKQTLKILFLGNSFTQDYVAYIPPILEELLPSYDITIGICYTSSASVGDHVERFNNNTMYTVFSKWETANGRWLKYSVGSSAAPGKTLKQVLTEFSWDIISVQGSCSIVDEEAPYREIVEPGRELLQILQANAKKPFSYVTTQWFGRESGGYSSLEVFNGISNVIDRVMDEIGFSDYIPVGCALQSARTNATLQSIGLSGDMLHDGTHLQAGLPALLAAYTAVLKILEWTGNKNIGLYRSTFIPTAENVVELNVVSTNSALTHGDIDGITEANVRAAREIATIAVRKPNTIIDCKNFV